MGLSTQQSERRAKGQRKAEILCLSLRILRGFLPFSEIFALSSALLRNRSQSMVVTAG